jgi:CRP-like cAMP-binding protein
VVRDDLARARAAITEAPSFRGLGTDAIEDLANRSVRRGFEHGASLVTAGGADESAFLIVWGRVDAVVYGASRLVTLAVARPGDWIGGEHVLGATHPVATWVAAESTMTLAWSRVDLLRHLDRHPGTALHLIRDLARRLRSADETISSMATADPRERVVGTLARLARRDGITTGEGFELARGPTHQDLANQIGTRRETVSRIFSQLLVEGLVVRRGRRLVVTSALVDRATRRAPEESPTPRTDPAARTS